MNLVTCCILAQGRAPTSFIRSNDCVRISPIRDEEDDATLWKPTRRYSFYGSLEVRAEVRDHDQDPAWRLFQPGRFGECDDETGSSSNRYVYMSHCFRCNSFHLLEGVSPPESVTCRVMDGWISDKQNREKRVRLKRLHLMPAHMRG